MRDESTKIIVLSSHETLRNIIYFIATHHLRTYSVQVPLDKSVETTKCKSNTFVLSLLHTLRILLFYFLLWMCANSPFTAERKLCGLSLS